MRSCSVESSIYSNKIDNRTDNKIKKNELNNLFNIKPVNIKPIKTIQIDLDNQNDLINLRNSQSSGFHFIARLPHNFKKLRRSFKNIFRKIN
jgi:hypothetical protein